MIYFDNVSKIYKDQAVSLDGVSLRIGSGEFVSLVGHSGAGKTTLLKMLIAQERPTSGVVFFDDINIHRLRGNAVPRHRRRIGTIFQDYKLLPGKTAYENIAFAMEAAGKADKDIISDVPYVLDLVNLAGMEGRFPYQLSGGERQRLAIARAIITQPDAILADEPTGNLDSAATYEVVQILKKINDLGTTIILTTHDEAIVDALGHRVITLEKGQVINDSGAEEVDESVDEAEEVGETTFAEEEYDPADDPTDDPNPDLPYGQEEVYQEPAQADPGDQENDLEETEY